MSNWKHKDMWSMRGKDFLVQVSRHGEEPREESSGCYDAEGPHRWAVYAYIYPEHPMFDKFHGDALWQDAASSLPLHCGCSFLHYHRDEKGVTSVQVGADYNHLYDTHFTRYATKEDAYRVFIDAEELADCLTARAEAVASIETMQGEGT